jgi:uncharacterized protein (DUF3820 family)
MTSANQETRPKSYTQRLIDVLQENKCPTKYLDLIKKFAADESEKREEQNQATKGVMTFGKFRGKQIREVFKLDPQYVSWLQKNNMYLSDANKIIVDELLKV